MRLILRGSRRTLRALPLVFLLALSLTTASAQGSKTSPEPTAQGAGSGFYYYADGERIDLVVDTEAVAAEFALSDGALSGQTAEINTQALTVTAQVITQAFPTAQMGEAIQPGVIAGYDFYLISVDGISTQADALSLVNAMRTSAALRFTWVNPVFKYQDVRLVLTDEFIAAFTPGTPRANVDAYNAANGAEVIRELSPDVYLLRALPRLNSTALSLANHYEEDGVVIYSEPNWVQLRPPLEGRGSAEPAMPHRDDAPPPATPDSVPPIQRLFTPNDTYTSLDWQMNNDGHLGTVPHKATADADIDAFEAWDITLGSNTIIIALLDDGTQINHPDLDAKIYLPRDEVGGDNDPTPNDSIYTRAYDAHGTHTSGMAGAETNNGIGTLGGCPNCKIMPIRIFYSYDAAGDLFSTDAVIASSFDYARTNGAQIISNSWGGGAPATVITTAIRNATTNARGGLGALVLFAAGNSYQSPLPYPATLARVVPGMLLVGASNWCDTIKQPDPPGDCSPEYWWGNNWGDAVGVTAPGHNMPAPDLTGTDGYSGTYGEGPDADYTDFNGTSSATPLTAGVAGLVLTLNSGFTADQMRDRLMTTTDPIYTAGFDVASGWGRVNAQKAVNNTTTNTGTANDHRSSATTVIVLPYTNTQSPAGTFMDKDDPALTCLSSGNRISNAIWYKFTPLYTMTATVNTIGSNYDTVLGVYNSALTSIGCNDDFSGLQSQVTFSATVGQTYNILIGLFNNDSGNYELPTNASLTVNISTSTTPPNFTFSGHVTLQRSTTPPNANWAVPVHVIVKPSTGGAATYDNTLSLDSSGNFSISNIPANNYNVWIKNSHTLANLSNVSLISSSSFDLGTLREGDADNGNTVTITDFAMLAAAFGTTTGGTGFDARADFNNDGAITILDFSLLAANFGLSGATAP